MEKNNLFGLPKWYFPRRFIIVALTFFAITLAYMMRSNLSIAILEMSDEFGWKATDKGMFLSSFFWGYITTQLIGGVAARRFGCKAMMAFVIIVPSMMTMLIPVLAPRSEFAFVACRVLTGVAAGGTFPTMFLLLGDWIPINEKAFCLALVYSGVNVGTIIVDVGGPKLMHSLGWQYIFYFTGGLGFVWLILWILFGASTPSEMKSIHPVEARYIEDNFAPKSDETTPIYKNIQAEEAGKEELLNNKEALNILFNNASFWNIVIGALCLNWGSYIFLTWLPTYANEQLHFDDQMSGIIAITPNISNAIVAFISGKICDLLVAKKYRLLLVRKTFMIMGSTCYVVTLVALAYKDQLGLSNVQAAILLACGTGGGGFHLPGYTANIYDIAPYHPSLVVGISNTAGTVPGIVGVFLTGILLQNGVSWGSIWLMTASFYAAAAIIHFVFCNVKRVV